MSDHPGKVCSSGVFAGTMKALNWQRPRVTVRPAGDDDAAAARALAARLALDLSDTGPADIGRMGRRRDHTPGAVWNLIVDKNERTLCRPDGLSLTLDFTKGRSAARQQESGLIRQPLARALGVSRLHKRLGRYPAIVDATGGLGRDSWFAAALGCRVVLIERSPIVHALLESALQTAFSDSTTRAIAERIDLCLGDASDRLGMLNDDQRDVVYLDPMYPDTRRRAEVTKGMQLLHALLGPDTDNAGLLSSALDAARCQVTVKRPPGAAALPGDETFAGQRSEIVSPGTRYDIYHVA